MGRGRHEHVVATAYGRGDPWTYCRPSGSSVQVVRELADREACVLALQLERRRCPGPADGRRAGAQADKQRSACRRAGGGGRRVALRCGRTWSVRSTPAPARSVASRWPTAAPPGPRPAAAPPSSSSIAPALRPRSKSTAPRSLPMQPFHSAQRQRTATAPFLVPRVLVRFLLSLRLPPAPGFQRRPRVSRDSFGDLGDPHPAVSVGVHASFSFSSPCKGCTFSSPILPVALLTAPLLFSQRCSAPHTPHTHSLSSQRWSAKTAC